MKGYRTLLSIICIILIGLATTFVSACSCGDKGFTSLKVIVNNKEITQTSYVVNMSVNAQFSLNENVVVYGVREQGETLLNAGDFTVETNLPNPLQVGQYELTVTYKNIKVQATIIVTNPDDRITSISDISKTYDGLPVSDPTYITRSGNEATISYYVKGSSEKLDSAPQNAGEYTCVLQTPTNNSYIGAEESFDFTISKANLQEESAHAPLYCTYSSAQTLEDLALAEHYTWADKSIVPVCNITEYSAIYNIDAQNYNDLEVTITVNVSPYEVQAPTCNDEYFYNTQDQTYNLEESAFYTIENATHKNAGSYNVTVSLKNKVNFTWKDSNSDDLNYIFTIQKATPQVPELNFVVDQGSSLFDIELPAGYAWNDGMPGTFNNYGNTELSANFTPTDTDNYNFVPQVAVNVLVVRLVPVPTVNTSTPLVYDGTSKSPLLTNYDSSIMSIVSGNSATYAGEYSVVISLDAENARWADDKQSGNKSLSWQIEKAPITLQAKTTGDYAPANLQTEYDGNYLATFDKLTNIMTTLPFAIMKNAIEVAYDPLVYGNFYVQMSNTWENSCLKLYTDDTLQETTTSVGTAYVALTYKLQNCQNYTLGADDTAQLIFEVSIVPQKLKYEGGLTLDYSSFDGTLGTIIIDDSTINVFVNLTSTPNSATLTKTSVNGTWAWVNDTREVGFEDNAEATFTLTTVNTSIEQTLTIELSLDIAVVDNIKAYIKKQTDADRTEVTRVDNTFSYTTTDFLAIYDVTFDIPKSCTCTYDLQTPSYTYTGYSYLQTSVITITPSTQFEILYNDTEYVITYHVTGALTVDLTFTLRVEQNVTTIYVNEVEWDGSSKVHYNDVIRVQNAETDLFDVMYIDGGERVNNTYTITLEDCGYSKIIDYLKNSVQVFRYYLSVEYMAPFEFITINGVDYELNTNYITIKHQLNEHEVSIDLTLTNPVIDNLKISYALNNGVYTPLDAGEYTIHDIDITDSIELAIFANDRHSSIMNIRIILKRYSYISQITYTLATGDTYQSTEDSVTFSTLVTGIECQVNTGYTFTLTNKGENSLTFGEANKTQAQYTIKVYNDLDALVETKEITVSYMIGLMLTSADGNNILTTLQANNKISLVVNNSNDMCLKLQSPAVQLTITIYSNDMAYTLTDFNAYDITSLYYVKIACNNDETIYLMLPLEIYRTSEINLNDIFSTTYISFEGKYGSSISFSLSSTQITSMYMAVYNDIQDIIDNLNDNILPTTLIDNTEYSIFATFDSDASLMNVRVFNNLDSSSFNLYVSVVKTGSLDNNTTLTVKVVDGNYEEIEGKYVLDNGNKTITFTNLETYNTIYINAMNNDAYIEVHKCASAGEINNGNLIVKHLSSVNFLFAGNFTYIVKIVATDGTIAYYTLTTSGTFNPLIITTIAGVDYNTQYNEMGAIAGFFDIVEQAEGPNKFIAHADASIIQGLSTLEVTTNALDFADVFDADGNCITNIATTFDIVNATLEVPAHIIFYIGTSFEYAMQAIIYFDQIS